MPIRRETEMKLSPQRRFFMFLEDRTVVVYGTAIPYSATVTRALAGHQALVYLADISMQRAEVAARRINDDGGVAEPATVDLFYRQAVEAYTQEVAEWSGGIDLAVIAIADENPAAQLMATETVCAHMVGQGYGIVLTLSSRGTADPEYLRLAERVAPSGVALLPAFGIPAPMPAADPATLRQA
ncbi:hypothetical protein [Streptomyces klenkii]|uniref:hypothetical protein n=1 Tax=Streptomyces klenkii TaxID=1420899 RepID=UPI0034401D1C